MKVYKLGYILLLLILFVQTLHATGNLIGQTPSELQVGHWINSEPRSLQDLRGKVVLIRWWTAPDCPYCSASSAALNEWHERYHSEGLEVIGLYHHKKSSPFSREDVAFFVDKFDFKFPVAIDTKWRTLRDWWLADNKRDWTSASFLLNQQGEIEYVHGGGSYIKGDDDYTEIEMRIKTLLDL